jgi:hypothetical protein
MAANKTEHNLHGDDIAVVDRALQDTAQLSQCTYSIAIAALVPGPQQSACIRWLLDNYVNVTTTRPTAYFSWQDIYVCAYATAIALRGAGYLDESDAIISGLQINSNDSARTETLTFGGLIAALDRYAYDRYALAVSHSPIIKTVMDDEARKLKKMLQWPDFYNAERSIAGFTGECLYGNAQIDLDRYISAFEMPNGSITSSPSVSAMTVLNYQQRGQTAPKSLCDYVSGLNPYVRTVGVLDQVSHFITGWALMHADAWRAELIQTEEVQSLQQALIRSPLVCAAGPTTYPGDLDTGSVAMIGLNWPLAERIRQIETASVEMFDEAHGCYYTYLFERNASVSTNIHILAAWPDNPRRDAVLSWLKTELSGPCDTWLCKWHVSAYYVAGEISRLLYNCDHPVAIELVSRARRFLVDRQRPDGGWGTAFSTTEETAYAVLALAVYKSELAGTSMAFQAQISHAQAFLRKTPDYTPLWIGKSLYCVRPLVQVLRHSALFHL